MTPEKKVPETFEAGHCMFIKRTPEGLTVVGRKSPLFYCLLRDVMDEKNSVVEETPDGYLTAYGPWKQSAQEQ